MNSTIYAGTQVTITTIENIVIEEFNISKEQLKAKTKHRAIALARYIVMQMSWRFVRPQLTFSDAAALYKKDHATFWYGKKLISDLLEFDKQFQGLYKRIELRVIETLEDYNSQNKRA